MNWDFSFLSLAELAFIFLVPVFLIPIGAWICFRNTETITGIRWTLMKMSAALAAAAWTAMWIAVVLALLHTDNYVAIRLIQLSALCIFAALPLAVFGKGPGRVLIGIASLGLTIGWMQFMGEASLFKAPQRTYSGKYIMAD
ncbi:MAG TPA: hypothetical protein VNR20_04825 [Terriglobales bacterium]|nr:hypothetical protein [Terriglobales bacterium]